jgi:hypothetical protein
VSTDGQAPPPASPVRAEPRQHSFLPSPGQLALAYEQDGGRITADGLARARGAGRPAGAKNKRTEKIARYFVHKYGDPIDIAGNIITTPLETLVATIRQADQGDRSEELDRLERVIDKLAKLGSDPKDIDKLYRKLMAFMSRGEIDAMQVAEWWRKIFADAFTYVHGRQPTSIEVAERKDAVLIIPGINAPTDVSQVDLAAAIEQRGLGALDFAGMKLIEDGQFEDAEGEGE